MFLSSKRLKVLVFLKKKNTLEIERNINIILESQSRLLMSTYQLPETGMLSESVKKENWLNWRQT